MFTIIKYLREDEQYLYVLINCNGFKDEMRIEKQGGKYLPSVLLTQIINNSTNLS